LLGSLLGVGGAAAAASAVPSMPLAAAVACAGALPPLAALWMVPRQMRDAAAGFVEEVLVLVPWQEEEQARSAAGPPEGPACSASDESVRASGELLAAFHVVDVLLQCPFLIRHLRLEEAQQAKPLLRRSGFVADTRPSFRHLCSLPSSEGGQSRVGRRGPLHINPTEGLSTDSALLAALLRSPKVLASEQMESREANEDAQLLKWRLPESLDELTEGFPESPPRRIQRLGRRCLALGSLGALCGVLFHQKPVSSLIFSHSVFALKPMKTLEPLSAPGLGSALDTVSPQPQLCEGEDVILGCFDELHSCQRCCDLSKGPLGDSACWAGRMNFNMCCGPASRLWAGCGWRGEDLWGHEYYSLEPPRLHSAAQCQNRCEEDSGCGGWTYFPDNWEPVGCRLPVAAILGLRRVCVLRATIDAPWSPHSGAIYGLRDCADLGGCLEVGRDRVGMDLGFIKEVPSAAACRLQCRETQECKAFSYFPDGYLGDASAGCVLPAAVFTWWKTRCLLKMHKTKPGGGEQWLPMGNVASGQRGCKPARPWRRWSNSHPSEDDLLAVDGDYRRERCSRGQPWRLELDAEYIVTRVMLWTGQLQTLPFRELLIYEVTLMVGEEELRCGSADENLGGNAMAVHCAQDTSRRPASAVIIRSSAGPAREFALCEVEVQVAPVPCDLLLDKGWTIHGRVVLIFPPGEASRAKLEDAGEACERAGGSFVETRSRPGRALCVEAACAPSRCLEEFDTEIENFAPLTILGLWNHDLERVADECGALGHSKARMFEATVMIYNGGHPDVGGSQMTTHWCFCAPSYCADDDAAMVVTRLVARHGLTWEALQPNSEIELRNVRALASWEDVKLDFLVAGFARSGTHTLRGNLMEHPEVKFAEQEMTFNWAALPQQLQVWRYASFFKDEEEGPRRRLWGGKGEGLAASQRVIRLASKIPKLRLVVMVREPVEWLESLYNLRKFYLCQQPRCSEVPSMEDVVLNGVTFEDVNVEDAFLSKSLEHVVKLFPPTAGRSLLLEFELLRSRPRELFDQITSFLGIEPFSRDFEIRRHATEDRRRYEELGLSVSLCSEQLRPSLAALKERLARENEYTRLVALLAQAMWEHGMWLLEHKCPVLATPAELAMIEYHHGSRLAIATVFIHVWWRDAMKEYFENASGLDSIWSGYTFILGFLIVFRSNQAYSRFWESVSLTHKIRGEWTSAFSSLLGFCTKSAEREAEVSHFREYLLRLMSLLHCYALHEVAELSDETNIEVVDLAGLSSESIEYLHASPDRCETVMLWIERLIVESEKQKLFDVAPPVLSRAFQELSDGMVNVAELRKIVEVPFPFPYSQYLSFMLVLHWIVSPLVAVQLISEWSWAGGTVWLISTSYWTLFYIAQEIDQPFGQDYNDLPVVEIQQRFNQSLMHLASPESYILPDFIAHVAQRRTVCMRTSRTTLRASAREQAVEPPETSLVDVVVEQDEASSTHLAEVLDEPAADIVLVSPHTEKTILGPRAVELVTRRGFSTGEPMQLQQHKSILRELAPPAWSKEDLDSFVDLVAAQKQLTEAREAPVAAAELKISLVELTTCFRDLASKARRNSAELQEETLRARAAEQADKLLALTQLLTGTSRRPGQENDEPFSVQST
ncbi:unnamed protein product, partial [Symbiodinium sp. CCMP2456]